MNSQLIEKQLKIRDCQISYLEGGVTSETSPILFLHGWGIAASPYREILQQLAQRYRVIAPDLPSFANSNYSQLLESYESYATILLSFIEALKIDRVHLMGHSLGGGISIVLSTLAPEKVKSLTLIDSTGIPTDPVPVVLVKRAIEMTAQISPSKLWLQFGEIPQVFSHNLFFNFPNVIQALMLSLEKDLRSHFPQIQSPTLLFWSEKDLTTPISSAQEMAQKISHSKLVTVEEGFHEWCLWYPEKFTATTLNFLDQTESSTPTSATL